MIRHVNLRPWEEGTRILKRLLATFSVIALANAWGVRSRAEVLRGGALGGSWKSISIHKAASMLSSLRSPSYKELVSY